MLRVEDVEEIIGRRQVDVTPLLLEYQQHWYMVILGDPPPHNISDQLSAALSDGTPVRLENLVVEVLQDVRDTAVST